MCNFDDNPWETFKLAAKYDQFKWAEAALAEMGGDRKWSTLNMNMLTGGNGIWDPGSISHRSRPRPDESEGRLGHDDYWGSVFDASWLAN